MEVEVKPKGPMKLVPVEGQVIRFYEEYEDETEKRAAQKDAVRARPTGKARAFILVDDREQNLLQDRRKAVTTVFQQSPGCPAPCPTALTIKEVASDFFRLKCRSVGRQYLPKGWKKALFDYYMIVEKGGKLFEIEEEEPESTTFDGGALE